MFKEFAENKNAKLPSSQYRGWAIWRTGTILLGAYFFVANSVSASSFYDNCCLWQNKSTHGGADVFLDPFYV